MTSVLYITYDGLLEPLGQSQVLAYLMQLSPAYRIHVLSFEKKADRMDGTAVAALRARLRGVNIGWTPLRYHKTPTAPATAFDVGVGVVVGLMLALRNRADILHVRSYVPALIALPIRKLTGARLLFDMRGFWADERVDGGLWPRNGRLYRLAKALEGRFLNAAEHIVTLTEASAKALRNFPALRGSGKPIAVIPTCADLSLFRPGPSSPAGDFVFGYIGSVGTWYMFEETLAFFRALLRRRPDARFLIVNRKEHDHIRALVRQAGIPLDRIELVSARHDEVAPLVRRMHLGAALIRPSFSKIASAPTKMAEYLGCGVPCLGNSGVGDVAEILQGRQVGLLLDTFDASSIDAAVGRALALLDDPALRSRCAEVARELFSLERGVAAYASIYQALVPPAAVPTEA
jgi:glycosyltransferase involved in cell wall biosynthesis